MDDNDKARFQKWLQNNTNFGAKVIRDTISRLNRVEKIMPLTANHAAEDFLFNLGKKPEFLVLGQSVKSQLRRAYKLYHESRNS